MRILHVVPTYYPATRYGGPIVSVHELCSALVRRGHDVHVFTTNVDGSGESKVPLGVPVIRNGVSVWYFPVPWFRRIYWSPKLRFALTRLVGSFSVLHTHSVFLWPTWAAARAARNAGVPYIVSPRGMLVKALIARKSSWFKRGWILLIERKNLQNADGIHVTSRAESNELESFGFSLPRVFEVANGVVGAPSDGLHSLPPLLDTAIRSKSPILLYLGRISWKKGLDRLIRAMPRVSEATLLIVGNDEENYGPTLQELSQELGVDGRVHFFPPVYGPAKDQLYRRATLFVLPSYSENFGNVVLEAMAQACPVLVTPEVGAARIVEDSGGGIVSRGDCESLAQAIERALSQPAALREMGELGRKRVLSMYSWDSIAQQMEREYDTLSREPRK